MPSNRGQQNRPPRTEQRRGFAYRESVSLAIGLVFVAPFLIVSMAAPQAGVPSSRSTKAPQPIASAT
jgi:hypothetical protein